MNLILHNIRKGLAKDIARKYCFIILRIGRMYVNLQLYLL